MNFVTFIYNAAKNSSGKPQLDSQIIISRNGRAVVTSPVRPVAIDPAADVTRIIHGADIALRNLAPGRYKLEVRINDRVNHSNATQHVMFDIE